MIKIEQRPVCSGVNFRSVRDSRFKTMRMSVNFMVPLKKETAAQNAIIPFLLSRSNRKYPDFTKLNERLAELYGAGLDADVQKLGDIQVLSVFAGGIADRYALNGESVAAELTSLLCSAVFEPAFRDGLFPKDDFEQEKRQMAETLDAEFNDKRLYALRRCSAIMCEKEPSGVNRFGTKEEIESLKREDLTDAWKKLIRGARVEILAVGDCDPEPIYRSFCNAFHSVERTETVPCENCVVKQPGATKEMTERADVAQSKLVMGFRTGCAETDKNVPAMKLMSALYGGSPSSKLFLNVREKMSLCYYCSSGYNPLKGTMFVQSGVEQKNIEKAKKEILNQLAEVQNGDFTDAEFEEAKLSLCNSYHTLSDLLDGLEGWCISKTFSNPVITPEEESDKVSATTRQELIDAAQNVALDTVYCLTGKEENAE